MAEVVEVLSRRQGSATFAELRTVVSGRAIRNALLAGQVRRTAKGVYALPKAPTAMAAARSHGGVVSYQSAAQHWGMKLITEPLIPHVTLPPTKAKRRASQERCVLHWADAPALDDVTTPIRTVLDCIRALPLSEALAIADSALHQEIVDADDLQTAAARLRGPHRRRIQRVVALADGRSESVLESALRAILIEAGIDGFEPQVAVRDRAFSARLDLGHRAAMIGLEADGFEHHSSRRQLIKDCRRGVNLTLRGWRVLRFSWEDVIYDASWVAASVAELTGAPPLTNSLLRAA
ncbi:DUF559 domain-containing protein [Kribbella sp. CA-293567]|uniref:DUF559 domain-containing protein n=1 Tax=Kribbella sp. CA-293567 TaxID=3002436 RepID=UPI0022DE417B|nr:DUF559 domain-containing protein [Kribbella sp. CA-293567]WBQ05820.1 DUF559 domain-containing protein [Kribbella sp. CA-293567]